MLHVLLASQAYSGKHTMRPLCQGSVANACPGNKPRQRIYVKQGIFDNDSAPILHIHTVLIDRMNKCTDMEPQPKRM